LKCNNVCRGNAATVSNRIRNWIHGGRLPTHRESPSYPKTRFYTTVWLCEIFVSVFEY